MQPASSDQFFSGCITGANAPLVASVRMSAKATASEITIYSGICSGHLLGKRCFLDIPHAFTCWADFQGQRLVFDRPPRTQVKRARRVGFTAKQQYGWG